MNGGSLPANFASTGNALEWLAFYTKDALLVVDDFAPSGRGADAALQNVAERLFRAAGNQQGRSRMGGDGQPHAPKLPRALILATGEEVPQGQSIRARLVIVEVRAGEVDRTRLSECQCAGREGQLAESMGAFVRWIAGRYEEVQGRLQHRRWRSAARVAGGRFTPGCRRLWRSCRRAGRCSSSSRRKSARLG